MIHHQHYFPVVNDQGKLMPAFLAVLNMEPEKPEVIARNLERVLTARLRDARFFWDADRKQPLESHRRAAGTVLFHKKLGSYARRPSASRRWRAGSAPRCSGSPSSPITPPTAGRLCKADLATDMVRELTELQGTMGGIYAREDGQPEEVWKAIYYHYLPVGVEADAPPTQEQLGAAAVDVGGRVAGRQARHGRRHVRGRRAADRVARSVRPAARGAGHRADPRRPARADRPRPRAARRSCARPADAADGRRGRARSGRS